MIGTETPVPMTLREMAADVARRVAAVAPTEGDPVSSLLALLVLDPRNTGHVRVVAAVIVADAMGDGWRETTANRWRPLVPTWVRPSVVGATVQRMIGAGLLVPTGRYVRCTDRASRNRGKLQPVYRLNLATLAADQPDIGVGTGS
ncbi:hypothetical protein [Actinophytocola sp.]|uniref:hypothetical protein n=1 Tax=Actinophytocola sp. TaxID=1872138 RepID=UPI003D6ACE79